MFILKLLTFALMCSMLLAEEVKEKPVVEILTEKSYVREDGYNFEFKTSDGVSRKEEGELIAVGDQKGIAVKGSYSYIAPNGQEYTVTFTADDKGFQPEIHSNPNSQ